MVLLHVAGQMTRHARRTTLHLPADWPWAAAILRAFQAPGCASGSRPSTQPARHRDPRSTRPDSALAAARRHEPSDHNKRMTRTAHTARLPAAGHLRPPHPKTAGSSP